MQVIHKNINNNRQADKTVLPSLHGSYITLHYTLTTLYTVRRRMGKKRKRRRRKGSVRVESAPPVGKQKKSLLSLFLRSFGNGRLSSGLLISCFDGPSSALARGSGLLWVGFFFGFALMNLLYARRQTIREDRKQTRPLKIERQKINEENVYGSHLHMYIRP